MLTKNKKNHASKNNDKKKKRRNKARATGRRATHKHQKNEKRRRKTRFALQPPGGNQVDGLPPASSACTIRELARSGMKPPSHKPNEITKAKTENRKSLFVGDCSHCTPAFMRKLSAPSLT